MRSRLTCLVTVATLCGQVALVVSAQAAAPSMATVPIGLAGTEAPLVTIRAQGRDLALQLDLGDESSLVLHPDVLAELRTGVTGRTAKFFGMDGSFETPIVRLAEIEIGPLRVQNVDVRADTHDEEFLRNKKSHVGAVGFIGAGALKSGQIEVDYARKTLKISLPDSAGVTQQLCRGPALPLIKGQYGLTSSFATERGVLHFGWDTGAPENLVSRATANALKLPKDQKSVVFARVGAAGQDVGPQQVGIWDNIPLPAEISGLIGFPFFAEHVVCFDYPRLLVHIQ